MLVKFENMANMKSSVRPTEHYLPSTKQQADKVLVNLVDCLEAKESDNSIFLRKNKTELIGK